jgi:hypothetical protein
VSRHHAQIIREGDQYTLHDLGSRNGTYVNGDRVLQPHPLRHADVITLPGCTFMFDLADDTVDWRETGRPRRGVAINPVTAEVWVDGRQVSVTEKEYLALVVLTARTGALVSKQDLATQVWPEYGGAVNDYNIEQVISRLRRKLEEEPEHPRYLITVRGLGYRLVTPDA